MELIHKYFPEFTPAQQNKFEQLSSVYTEWNAKINLISRKDMEFFYERHVLYSLAIACYIKFIPNTVIADVGTGGGFPGIPLSIAFPGSNFILIDSIAKKIKVVNEVKRILKLENVTTLTDRSEKLKFKCDFVVSRAVSALPSFYANVQHLVRREKNNSLPNGILYLKGGDFMDELDAIPHKISLSSVADFFEEPFFETKKLVYINMVSRF